jgi:hypothetical protein
MHAVAAAELQIDVGAGLAEPDRALGSTQLDESELCFKHFDYRFEMPAIQAIGDMIELHNDTLDVRGLTPLVAR